MISEERYLAVQFILSTDRERYGKLVQELENKYSRGKKINQWPISISDAYDLLQTFRYDPKFYMKSVHDGEAGLMFTTTSSNKFNDGSGNSSGNPRFKSKYKQPFDINKVKCWKLQQKGHYSNECKNEKWISSGIMMIFKRLQD